MSLITLKVKGTHCKSCKMLIEDELEDLGASDITIDIDEDKEESIVSCEIDMPKKKVIAAIEELGDYKVQ